MGLRAVYAKTLADLSNPKVLVGFYAPYLVVSGMMALGMSNNEFEGVRSVAQQEATLASSFLIIAFFLGVGFPFLALVAVLTANTLAREAELGTLRIVLSKPTPRWRVLVATYAAVVSFSALVALASLLLPTVGLYVWSGADAAALSGGVFRWVAPSVAYGVFGAAFVAAVAMAFAVRTEDRLKTTLGAFLIPALHFGFLPIRIMADGLYEDFSLFVIDVNYHFGHAFVLAHELLGTEPGPTAQRQLVELTGVYEAPAGGAPDTGKSLALVEHVPRELSVLLLVGVGAASLAAALYRFRRMDV